MQNLRVVLADLTSPAQQRIVVDLINSYASDPFGNGQPLSETVQQELGPALLRHPTTMVLVAYMDDQPAGIVVCFGGFSTFAARPLMNIHDVSVRPEFRGRGIGRALLNDVAVRAAEMGCCKLTLEALENNLPARQLYESLGFSHISAPHTGGTLFFSRPLVDSRGE